MDSRSRGGGVHVDHAADHRDSPQSEAGDERRSGSAHDPREAGSEFDVRRLLQPRRGSPAADQWFTDEQVEYLRNVALAEMTPAIREKIETALEPLKRSGWISATVSGGDAGYFFRGARCPSDGAGTDGSLTISAAVDRLESENAKVTPEELRCVGLTDELLKQVVIVDFPDGIVPLDYFRPIQATACPRCGHYLAPDLRIPGLY